MSAITSITAPSPVPNQMGCFLDSGGCTFRAWALFAASLAVKIWNAAGTTTVTPMAPDSASGGYGNNVWSVYIPGITEETNYRYVVGTPAGTTIERVDPQARSIVYPNWTDATQDDSDARSVVTSRDFDWGPAFQAPGWRQLVIYQLHIGTFYNPTIGAANKVDDLIRQIPYLQNLGVNAVQLLPYIEFASPLSLGYDPVLPFAIERDYGSPEDFKRLVQALHSAGMSVLADVVYNHIDVSIGGATPLSYSLFQWDGWNDNACGIYFYSDADEMDTPWGPRPNYGRPAVTQFLVDNAMMWLNEYQFDGVRFDSTICIRKRQGNCQTTCCGADIGVQQNFGWQLMQAVNYQVNSSTPWKLTIAEDLNGNAAITSPTSGGGAGFAAQWDTDLMSALRNALTQAFDSNVDVGAVAFAMQNPFEGDVWKRVIYLESHDQADSARVPALIDPGNPTSWFARKKSMLGFAAVLATPGIPMFFQGAELLDTRPWSPGSAGPPPVPPTLMNFNLLNQYPKLSQFYHDMVLLRKSTQGLCGSGLNVFHVDPTSKVLAWHRWDQGSGADDVVVVANFSDTSFPSYTIGFPYAGNWNVCLNSDANVYSDSNDFGAVNCYNTTAAGPGMDGLQFQGNVGIGPYTLIVLTR